MKGNGKSFRQGSRNLELEREIKESAIKELDLRHCLEFCGLKFNANGFASCPFHKERTASFRVHGRFWKCFGCGESGGLVKFYRKKFDLRYDEALDAICRDFGLNTAKPTIHDLERLDSLRLERYNCVRRYDALLRELDIWTKLYWLAYDTLEYAIQFKGGKSIENDSYVSAHFALMAAQRRLEQAESSQNGILPPAPKWREQITLW